MKEEKANDLFSTKVGAIAAAAGSAVGLGNIWRFPYVLGENGGAAFLVVYIISTILIAIPVLLTEFVIGRKTNLPVSGAYNSLAPNKWWNQIGIIGVLCAFIILSFYNVVAGWTMCYTVRSATGALQGLSEDAIQQAFVSLSESPWECLIWMVVTIVASAFIVSRGVKRGIEWSSRILMPLLLLLIIVVCVRSLTLDGALQGVQFLLSPDFSKITPQSIFEALGQSFFSLSIGMGTMTTYGAYISKKQNLTSCAFSVAFVDFVIAFLAALMIMPCAFACGINPGSGPGLVFVTLPNIFNAIMFGQAISFVFFLLLFIAALTSSVSLLEVIVAYFMNEHSFSRRKATVVSAILIGIFGTLCAFSKTLFGLFDNFSANVMLPLGALFIILFAPIILGRTGMRNELEAHGGKCKLFGLYYALVRYVVPIAIVIIFVNCIMSWMGVKIFA
ncbi:MAG: sodium-dependent transporter [Bacteroidales bacterium]|nr:sodium-dependent transporter [Bacteroidales bacterium]